MRTKVLQLSDQKKTPIHMSIMKETRWLPKKCPMQKNNEISATEMITTELYTS